MKKINKIISNIIDSYNFYFINRNIYEIIFVILSLYVVISSCLFVIENETVYEVFYYLKNQILHYIDSAIIIIFLLEHIIKIFVCGLLYIRVYF